MLYTLCHRARAGLARLLGKAKRLLHETMRPLPVLAGVLRDSTRSRGQLVAKNALLRQQLIVACQSTKRPAFKPHERGLMVLLSRIVRSWRDAVLLVKPATVLRWHREGFRLFWKLKCRAPKQSNSRISSDIKDLICQMATENMTWGAERIRGDLLKLGIHVAKRTIQRHMNKVRPPDLPRSQRWQTFLRNHVVWACDFLQTYDIWFRPIFAFFVIDVNTKRVVHVGTTRSPTAEWTAQQLRYVTPFGEGPEFIIRDNDSKFGADFDRVAKGAGTRVLRTAVRAPLMNATCERFIGSVRREWLDHVIILGRRHLRQVLEEFSLRYFNTSRPHQGIGQRVPVPSPSQTYRKGTKINSVPVLGGLHHDYQVAA